MVCAHAGYLGAPAISTAYISKPVYGAYAAPAYAAPAYTATYAAPALIKAAAPAVDYYVSNSNEHKTVTNTLCK